MTIGTVKFFNPTKGFGFVKNNENEQDQAFVHVSVLNGLEIEENDEVEYEAVPTEKGQNVISIKIIKKAA